MHTSIRDWLFPKVPLVPIEFDSEGWMVFFGGSRRHKILKQTEEEFVFQCQYSGTDPYTTGGRESSAFPALHWHSGQDEAITVLSGRIGYVLNGKEGFATTGDVLTIPRGATHTFWCAPAHGEDAVLEFSARPGSGIDADWLNTVYGTMESLYRQGKVLGGFQVLVFALDSESGPGALPKWLGIPLVQILGRVGLWAGYRATYPIYQNLVPPKANGVSASGSNCHDSKDVHQRR